MKTRTPWILILLCALIVGAALLLREKPARPAATAASVPEPAPVSGSFSPNVELRVPVPKPNLVDIEDGKTIDFSSGLPLIKDSEKEKAALARALKEIEEAAANVSFGAAPAGEKKSATP